LGKVPMKTAATVRARVENLLATALGKHAIDGDTAAWAGSLYSRLYGKLAAFGLVPRREPVPRATSGKKRHKPLTIKGLCYSVEGSTRTYQNH
jgi:hypothetical protein